MNIADREKLPKPGGFWGGMILCLVIFLAAGAFYTLRDREWQSEAMEGRDIDWMKSVTVTLSDRGAVELQGEDLTEMRRLWPELTHSESRVSSYISYLEKPVLFLQLKGSDRETVVQIGANGLLQLRGNRGWHLYGDAGELHWLLAASR